MYSFDDRSGDNLSLRPEGTAGCVRAADQHGLLYNQQQRLWYHGPMFRHERPQKGRYRQFHQFGIEAFGLTGPDIDAEVILLSAQLFRELGISEGLVLEINNIGSAEDRRTYGIELVSYLSKFKDQLDPDSQRRLDSNPLRILDSKSPDTAEILQNAPVLSEFLNQSSIEHFNQLKQFLTDAGLEFQENPKLVRGLDYYNNAVFEWTTQDLGAQGTVCAGGRYDGLVAQLGGKPTPAVGFAIGEERLVLLLEEKDAVPQHAKKTVDVFLAIVGDNLVSQGIQLGQSIRQHHQGLSVQVNCGGGKFNSQMKKAYNSGAKLAIILEQIDETNDTPLTEVKLRMLEDNEAPVVVPLSSLDEHLKLLLTL
jgi:histidyl-tRNA synthetase